MDRDFCEFNFVYAYPHESIDIYLIVVGKFFNHTIKKYRKKYLLFIAKKRFDKSIFKTGNRIKCYTKRQHIVQIVESKEIYLQKTLKISKINEIRTGVFIVTDIHKSTFYIPNWVLEQTTINVGDNILVDYNPHNFEISKVQKL